MAEKYLSKVYQYSGPQADLYDDWAASYDEELGQNAYATPGRIAEAVAAHLPDRTAPILDFACGTGLSGQALASAGFSVIDGYDVSEGMLAQAAAKGVYRELFLGAESGPPEIPPGYLAIAAVGAISPGAAPARLIRPLAEALPAGGILALSLNDHGLADETFTGALDALVSDGLAEKLHSAHGSHLPEMGLGATVFVFRRT